MDRASEILESIGEAFFALDPEWRFVYVNRGGEKLLQHSREDLLGHVLWDVYPEAVGTRFETEYRRAMAEQVPVAFEEAYEPFGERYEVRAYPTPDGLSVYFFDVTERERAKSDLEAERRILRDTIDSMPIGVAIIGREGELLDVNEANRRGWMGESDEPLPERAGGLHGFWPETGEPLKQNDWPAARVLESGEIVRDQVIEVERADGKRVITRVSAVPLFDERGEIDRVVTVTEDITEERESQRLIDALTEIDRVIHSTLEFDEVMKKVVAEARLALRSDAAVIELRENGEWPVRYVEGLPETVIGKPLTDVAVISQQVAKDISVLAVPDTSVRDELAQIAAGAGVCAFLAAPLTVRGEVLGVLIFLELWRVRSYPPYEVDFAKRLAASVSLALENARLYEAQQQELERTRLLQDVATAAATTLDVTEISRAVLHELHEHLDLQAASVHFLDQQAGVLRQIARFGFPEDVEAEVQVVEASRDSLVGMVVVDCLDIFTHESGEVPEATKVRLRNMRFEDTRWLCLPIRRTGEALGVLTLIFKGRRPFQPDELELYRAVAASLGTTLSHARLYQNEHRVAEALQSALLDVPTHVTGVEHAELYHSAAEAARVGGDFYDLFEVRPGLVAVEIGDVSGKGLAAASFTATVRDAVRMCALEGSSPAQVVAKTNEVIEHFTAEDVFVTLFFGILDVQTGVLSYVLAGHPSPLIARADGSIDALEGTSPLVGLFESVEFSTNIASLRTGDTLLLYTDGIIEARHEGEFLGIEGLSRALFDIVGDDTPLEDVLEMVTGHAERFAGQPLRDDVALMAVRLAR